MRLEIKCSPEYIAAPLNRKPTELRKGEFPLPGALLDELPEDGQGQVVCLLWCVESKSRKHEEEAEQLFQGKPEDTC